MQIEDIRTWVNAGWIQKKSNNSVITNGSLHSKVLDLVEETGKEGKATQKGFCPYVK